MKNRKKLHIVGIFLVITAMIISTSASAANIENNKQTIPDNQVIRKPSLMSTSTHQTSPVPRDARDTIVWDNGMEYDGLITTQEPITPGNIDGYPADDFQFKEDTEICNIHWIGGYYNGEPQEWDWYIIFFEDRGDGNAPGYDYAGPFLYTWADIGKEELQPGYYERWVDLSENVFFQVGNK